MQFHVVCSTPKSRNADIIEGKHTKAHGIRHKWLSGLRNTLRLELGTIQNGDVGIRHKILADR